MTADTTRWSLRPPAWLVWLGVAVACCLLLVAGSHPPKFTPQAPATSDVEVTVTDEHGQAIADATVSNGRVSARTDSDGRVTIELERPASVVVSAPDFLDEPVAIGPTDARVAVNLWARVDDDGRHRTSIHFGGDVMLGRRYLDPDRRTPFVDDAATARRVVAEVSDMAASADTTVVNLESVIGDAPADRALPAKRFLIQSSPLVTETLDELGVDLVTLGNNHAYDWGESGLGSTIAALEAADIAHVGAGADHDEAARGRIIDSSGLALGIVSVTTVTGDFVNDRLPGPDVDPPADLAEADAWQYEDRLFGLRPATDADAALGDTQVALRPIRISEAWKIVESAEAHLPPDDAVKTWRLVQSAFPELQDWVARRGHGGAGHYRPDAVAGEIARLRGAGADVIVVQFHGGFQFAAVESDFMRTASRRAIDAGADAVVSHHPHVLQGVEWYDDSLIAYSLGNLVFDQDFHSTFPSALLRIITDGDQTLEARLLPLVLDRYRPTPLTGEAARNVVATIGARTALDASSRRIDQHVRTVLDDVDDPVDRADGRVRFERNSGLIEPQPPTVRSRSVDLPKGEAVALWPCTSVRADLIPPGVEFGRELLQWGSFDRSTTDASRTFPLGWLVPSDHRRWRTIDGATGLPGDVAIELATAPNESTALRIAALVDVPAHRWFDESGRPVDAEARHELRLRIRRNRGEAPIARLTTYARLDTDPTIDPITERLEQIERPLDVPGDGAWHAIAIPIPVEFIGDDPDIASALGFALVLPPAHVGTVSVDDVEIVEWRGGSVDDRSAWAPATFVRAIPGPEPLRNADLDLGGC